MQSPGEAQGRSRGGSGEVQSPGEAQGRSRGGPGPGPRGGPTSPPSPSSPSPSPSPSLVGAISAQRACGCIFWLKYFRLLVKLSQTPIILPSGFHVCLTMSARSTLFWRYLSTLTLVTSRATFAFGPGGSSRITQTTTLHQCEGQSLVMFSCSGAPCLVMLFLCFGGGRGG